MPQYRRNVTQYFGQSYNPDRRKKLRGEQTSNPINFYFTLGF